MTFRIFFTLAIAITFGFASHHYAEYATVMKIICGSGIGAVIMIAIAEWFSNGAMMDGIRRNKEEIGVYVLNYDNFSTFVSLFIAGILRLIFGISMLWLFVTYLFV